MSSHRETTVLIVGAGPVGLTLAMDLKSRGVDVLVVEQRATQVPWMARCNTVAARSMEIFRRLGVADSIRAAGLPDDYSNDVAWVTRVNGHEIARVHLASRNTRFTDTTAADFGWSTSEPVHRASQLLYDQVLHDHAASRWGVPIVMGHALLDYQETADGVLARIQPAAGGEAFTVRSDWLVGCDGGSSTVRRRMGATLSGDDALYRSRSTLIRAPWMLDHFTGKPAWMFHFLGPGPFGGMIAIDGRELWLVQIYLPRGETDFEAVDADAAIRQVLDIPAHLRYEVVHRHDWVARRLVADRFRDGRVFICGDSAHLWPPFGGHGMNAGLADAANLAWTLAAVIQGWAGPAMLDVYERERRPVTDQVSRFAMDKVIAYTAANQQAGAARDYDRDDDQGAAMRARTAERLLRVNAPQYATAGLNFAYYYDQSPIIAYDGEAPPPYDMGVYTPSTAPGCRMPHFRLPDGRWLYDLLGDGYTLLRFDPGLVVDALMAAAARRQAPLQALDLANPDPRLVRHGLILVRPDQHVAWRGDAPPDEPDALVDLIRAARPNPTLARPRSAAEKAHAA